VKIIPLNQQDANDLLALITSQALTITANNAARVHQLQALLSTEPREFEPVSVPRENVAVLYEPSGA
jgi:hypothetical protein